VVCVQDGPYWHIPSRDTSVAPTFVKNADLTSPMAWLCVGPPPEAAQLDHTAATSAAVMAAVAMDRRSISPPLGGVVGGRTNLPKNHGPEIFTEITQNSVLFSVAQGIF
jgi:hypothetical protein